MRRSTVLVGTTLALLCAAGCSNDSAVTSARPSAGATVTASVSAAPASATTAPSATAASATAGAATGTPTPAADHARAVRAAAEATGRTSARVDQNVELTDGETTYHLTVAGDFDLAADRGQLGVDLPGGGISHVDEIFADGQVYVRGSAGLPKGTWGAIDRERTVAHALLRAPVNDPEHFLQQIATLTRVTRGAEEDVNGVRAARYSGFLSDEAVTLRLTPEVRGKTEQFRAVSGTGVQIPAEVWVDAEGRVVKVRLVLDMNPVRSVTTVSFTQLGKPVKVSAPAAGITAAVTELTGVLTG
ncbi:hypothetical protein ACFVHB_28650 [Kitasatospora sp. NPDC127111]|uniref:hypothetical protein n=1 Tax=Kitasatospora sp. NPDC127111 TaxID=3345363 RepID=UPI0036297023